jgi:chorismate mutase
MMPDSLNRPRKHDLRSMVDRYDKQILSALGHRVDVVRKIGKIKMNQATPVVDPDRERRMMVQRQEWGQSLGLPQELVDEIFAVIMKHSSRIQSEKKQL